MSGASSPDDGRSHSASTQDGSKPAAKSLWSKDECLFIQLQAELALAVASLPIPSALLANSSACYQNFCRFFEKVNEHSPEGALARTTSMVRRSEEEYAFKQEELVASVVLKTRNLAAKARKAGGSKQLKWWTVAPGVFDEYRKIREVVGYDTEVRDPRDRPEMWAFLDRVVREKFPDSCTIKTTSAGADKNDIASEVAADDIAPDSLAHGGTGRVDPHTTIYTAPASGDPPVVGTTRPRTTTIAEPTQVPDINTVPSQARQPKRTTHVAGKPENRLGPEDFAKETGPIICTTYCKDGRRCTLHAPKETREEKRPTYVCHVHRSAQLKALEAVNGKEPKRKKMVPDQDGEMKPRASAKHAMQAATLIEEEEDDSANNEEPPRKRAKLTLKLTTPGAGTTMRASNDLSDDGPGEKEDEEPEEEEGDENEEGEEEGDENEEGEEEEDEEPPKKRIKSARKSRKGKGHSANRAKNDTWYDEERQYLVDVFNDWIEEHGLVSWQDNFTKLLEEALDQINEYRSSYPERYAGRAPRGINGVRSQVTKKDPIELARAEANKFRAKIANGKTIEDAELKRRNYFELADITPKSRQKNL